MAGADGVVRRQISADRDVRRFIRRAADTVQIDRLQKLAGNDVLVGEAGVAARQDDVPQPIGRPALQVEAAGILEVAEVIGVKRSRPAEQVLIRGARHGRFVDQEEAIPRNRQIRGRRGGLQQSLHVDPGAWS